MNIPEDPQVTIAILEGTVSELQAKLDDRIEWIKVRDGQMKAMHENLSLLESKLAEAELNAKPDTTIAQLIQLVKDKNALLRCYRIGGSPRMNLLDRLEKENQWFEALTEKA